MRILNDKHIIIDNPEVYFDTTEDTYVILGDFRIDKIHSLVPTETLESQDDVGIDKDTNKGSYLVSRG